MTNRLPSSTSGWAHSLRTAAFGAALALIFAVAGVPGQAQTYNVIYAFHGNDGAGPAAGVTMDGAGNLYGTTEFGGAQNGGVAYQLLRRGSGWILKPLHQFGVGSDGLNPLATVVFGPDGSLYGTTAYGGSNSCTAGCGTVFRLRPPPNACKTTLCPWTESVTYRFQGGLADGSNPGYGNLAFDHNGNIYGTTEFGGEAGCFDATCGTVYELSASNGGWTEAVIYLFPLGGGGENPPSHPLRGVVFDSSGNLYGTTSFVSAVYELTPGQNGWSATTLYNFYGLNAGGIIRDESGNLYGVTGAGGMDPGIAYELSHAGSGWTLTTLYSFGQSSQMPWSTLAMDAGGNLYGVTATGGQFGHGAVFKLAQSEGRWTYTSLHDFTGGSDGGYPQGRLIVDANGDVYGTAATGGLEYGVVFEITP